MEERTKSAVRQRGVLPVYHLRSNWCSRAKASILNGEKRTSIDRKKHHERFCVNSVETVFDFLLPIAAKDEKLLLHFARLEATFYTRGQNRGSRKNERSRACRSLVGKNLFIIEKKIKTERICIVIELKKQFWRFKKGEKLAERRVKNEGSL